MIELICAISAGVSNGFVIIMKVVENKKINVFNSWTEKFNEVHG